ncbi:MAG TPA: DUF1214 domain-containing protein [Ornithinicoccus sp.]|nr:DUF1214 domain-containing protein [Ornithinicoccus sp.]
MAIRVNVDNFVRAETARMLADIQTGAGGVNTFRHNREPAPIDEQTVIRLNRDTFYSFAVVDLASGGRLSMPDPGDRYVSIMVVNEDHLINEVHHGAGPFDLDADRAGTRYALVAVRTLVDSDDPNDIAAVSALQDQYHLELPSAEPFAMPEYDAVSLGETRDALLELARGLDDLDGMFGSRDEVEPVRHLIGTAAGWGGLPTSEAVYVGMEPQLPRGTYAMTFQDVPVDAFWSVSVYNAAGFFEPNSSGTYTVNSVTGTPDADGSITVHLVSGDDLGDLRNAIQTPADWNLLIRLYQPRSEVLDGSWTPPQIVSVGGPASR